MMATHIPSQPAFVFQLWNIEGKNLAVECVKVV